MGPREAASNFRKHRVRFEVGEQAFVDPNAVLLPDRVVDGEQRWQTIGYTNAVLLTIVVHTVKFEDDDEIIRIISARKATSKERRMYEEQNRD